MLCKDAKAKKLAIGLMSGTSADGIDAVLVEISGCSTSTHVRQMAFVTLPFTDAVRSRILQVAAGNFGGSEELCLMNFLLGKLSADACLAVCAQAGVDPRNVAFVGSHGQTVFHAPVEQDYLGYKVRGTLQIGEASMIVEALGCHVVSDFRGIWLQAALVRRWCRIPSICFTRTRSAMWHCRTLAVLATSRFCPAVRA